MLLFYRGRRRHYSVVFGLHDTRDNSGSRVVPISNLIRHRNYDSVTMANDIAILEVTITQNDLADTFATPICLASRDYANGEVAEVSGWGTLSEGWSLTPCLFTVLLPDAVLPQAEFHMNFSEDDKIWRSIPLLMMYIGKVACGMSLPNPDQGQENTVK